VSIPAVTTQSGRHCVAHIKADAGAAEVTVVRPLAVPDHLIVGAETSPLDGARCKAERHRCVVGPLTRQKPEGAATNHVRQGLEGTAAAEFQSRPDGITDGKSKKTSTMSSALIHFVSGGLTYPHQTDVGERSVARRGGQSLSHHLQRN